MDETKFMRCVTEDSRRNILKFLGKEEKCVCEIVEYLGKEQSVISHHLASLRNCGLVSNRQDGKRILYKVTNPEIIEFLIMGEKLARSMEGDVGECE